MKKLGILIAFLLLVGFSSHAQLQLSANRTGETKVADLLAVQPSENAEDLDKVMKEMEGFTQEDFSLMLQSLEPQGGTNDKVEYATNSYSFYVMQPGKENLRKTYVEGLLDALDKIENKDNKAYIFSLLNHAAKEEAVEVIAPYLLNKDLTGEAARALSNIGSESAKEALSNALNQADNPAVVVAVVSALGDLEVSGAESQVAAQLNKYDYPELNRTVYAALSKLGGVSSVSVFEKALKNDGYQYEENNLTNSALNFASHLSKTGNEKQAIQLLNSIYKGATKAKQLQAQVGALGLLSKLQPKKSKKLLLSAVSSDSPELRKLGLDALASDKGVMTKLLRTLPKASPGTQESILLFLAANKMPASLNLIKPLVNSKDLGVRLAAFQALNRISKEDNVPLFIDHLGENKEQDQLLKNLILSSKESNTVDLINQSLASSSNEKQQALLLDLLSVRSNSGSFDAVLPFAKSNNAALKDKAFQALPNVSTDSDVEQLLDLAPQADEKQLANLQQAGIQALKNSDLKSDAVSYLSSLSGELTPTTARQYFPVFAGLGGAQALKKVDGYTHSSNAELKSQAIQALANWTDAEALSSLLKLFKEPQSDADFNVIFKGLVSKINQSDETNARKSLYLREAFDHARTVDQKKLALSSMQNVDTYQAFKFAAQYLEDKDLRNAATDVVMNIAVGNLDYYGTEVRSALEKIENNLSGNEGSYLLEAVKRHLNEMPKKEGFLTIFNGKDLTGWKGLVENPIARSKMSEEELAQKQEDADQAMHDGWYVEDGNLIFRGKGDNIATTKEYGDFVMLVDWKLDKNGQEPDAGIYLRGTPQVQIWDTSRTNVGAQVGSGGLYNNTKYEDIPLKVADNPLGEWNTFKIKMVGDKVSVWLNGELVTDAVPLENYWDRDQPIFPKEQIELQAHGSKVYYRDIYIKELPRKEIYTLSPEEKAEGFKMLFDGTNIDQWEGSNAYAINEAGELWIDPDAQDDRTGRNFFTKKEYSDFVYRFEFKLTPGANNGVGIRAPLEGDAAYQGMEIQILDNTADIYKNLQKYQYHGSVYGVIPAKRGALNPVGEWNEEEIRIQGSKIKVTVNGKVIVDGDIKEASKNGTMDGKDHPGLKRTQGHIGFLGHGDVLYFRNIRIKEL